MFLCAVKCPWKPSSYLLLCGVSSTSALCEEDALRIARSWRRVGGRQQRGGGSAAVAASPEAAPAATTKVNSHGRTIRLPRKYK